MQLIHLFVQCVEKQKKFRCVAELLPVVARNSVFALWSLPSLLVLCSFTYCLFCSLANVQQHVRISEFICLFFCLRVVTCGYFCCSKNIMHVDRRWLSAEVVRKLCFRTVHVEVCSLSEHVITCRVCCVLFVRIEIVNALQQAIVNLLAFRSCQHEFWLVVTGCVCDYIPQRVRTAV